MGYAEYEVSDRVLNSQFDSELGNMIAKVLNQKELDVESYVGLFFSMYEAVFRRKADTTLPVNEEYCTWLLNEFINTPQSAPLDE